MSRLRADLEALFEIRDNRLALLIELAERCDRFVGTPPPDGGHNLGSAVASIFNGGSAEEIEAGLHILTGWRFKPKEDPPLVEGDL